MKTVQDVMSDLAIRWTRNVDPIDEKMFITTVTNLWLAQNHAVGNDRTDWNSKLADYKKLCLARGFAGLTVLDTLQSVTGVPSLTDYALTPHEGQVLQIIGAQECTHVQAYSHIFMELDGNAVADVHFDWVNSHPTIREKERLIHDAYLTRDGLKVRAASVTLENGFFYTGFFYILYLHSHEKVLTETVSVIRAIIRDEALHGYYIGYKYQQAIKNKTPEEKAYYKAYVEELFLKAYDIETRYIDDLYADTGLAEEVKKFLCYNMNKGMQNLGYDDLFPEELCCPDGAVRAALDAADEHDSFSTTSASYKTVAEEDMSAEEWAGY